MPLIINYLSQKQKNEPIVKKPKGIFNSINLPLKTSTVSLVILNIEPDKASLDCNQKP